VGNYEENDAKQLHSKVLAGLGAKSGVKEDDVEKVGHVVMPSTPVELRKTNPRPGDENHVTIVTLLAGPATVPSRVLMGLVGWMYSQVVFAELRTKQSLGYVVGGSVSEMSTILTVDCYVQGTKKLPDEVEGLCEHVWAKTVPKEIGDLDDATFKSHKDSFKSSLLEGPLTTNQELSHFEDPILLGGCLGLRSAMLEFLDTVTSKHQLLEAWNSVIQPMNGTKVALRKKVVTKYWSDSIAVPQAPSASKAKELYKKAGLDGTILERMMKERELIMHVSQANSTVRNNLVKEGGYFPTELHCAWSNRSQVETQPQQPKEPDFQVLAAHTGQLQQMTTAADHARM